MAGDAGANCATWTTTMPRPTKGEVYWRGARPWIRFQVNDKRYDEPAKGCDTAIQARALL
jgi:hypothetical protein